MIDWLNINCVIERVSSIFDSRREMSILCLKSCIWGIKDGVGWDGKGFDWELKAKEKETKKLKKRKRDLHWILEEQWWVKTATKTRTWPWIAICQVHSSLSRYFLSNDIYFHMISKTSHPSDIIFFPFVFLLSFRLCLHSSVIDRSPAKTKKWMFLLTCRIVIRSLFLAWLQKCR